MIFGKRSFINRFILTHFAHTFSLSYFLRLIAALVGSYSRSRRAAQERSASAGGHVLRRIYGHIVAQGLGGEKLTASLDMSALPRRTLGAIGQIGMASVIVLVAWGYWPGEAAAPALVSAGAQPAAAQLALPSPANNDNGAALSIPAQSFAENSSPQQITDTKERFAALAVQQQPAQRDAAPVVSRSGVLKYGAEIEDAPSLLAISPTVTESEPAATQPVPEPSASEDASVGPSRPGGLSDLLASLANSAARPRAVEAQPTSTPPPPAPAPTSQPTQGPAAALLPGLQWPDFTPAAAPAVDHFWLGQPHPPGYNQLYSPNYQFGSTANARYRIHHGVDISSDAGTPVLAMGEGEVVHAGPDNPTLLWPYNNFYGNSVVVRLNRRLPTPQGDQDVYVLLGHLSEVYVERGQQVTADVVVGAVGMTGIAIGPHLHVEVRVGQNSYLDSVNPALWMQNPPGMGSVAARLLTADGRSWSDARLSLLRYEGGSSRWVRTLEIYPDAENISADPAWGENGALSQLAAGGYWIGGVVNGEKFGQNITIYPGETTFVEFRTQQ